MVVSSFVSRGRKNEPLPDSGEGFSVTLEINRAIEAKSETKEPAKTESRKQQKLNMELQLYNLMLEGGDYAQAK